jgi:predicted hydrocarbon binding protein
MNDPGIPLLPVRFFRLFLNILNTELDRDAFVTVLKQAGLPAHLAEPNSVSGYTSRSGAETYAGIQKAMRVYYGRGARGMLIRFGRLLWTHLLESASIPEKARAQLIRTLPAAMRIKPSLELLAYLMGEKQFSVTVHTLDLDMLLIDHTAAAAIGQSETGAVCYVTLGLIQENLFWATGHEHDIDEVSCRAAGGNECEFKIMLEGKG